MPTRKQRRRRRKERRHEYEFVYVDEEGHEVEVEPKEIERNSRPRDAAGSQQKAAGKGRQTRAPRPVAPPSWNKVGKRALIFFPLIFIAFSLVQRHQSLVARLAVTLLYTALFVPLMYLMDRTMYRAYLKRTGQGPSSRPGRRR